MSFREKGNPDSFSTPASAEVTLPDDSDETLQKSPYRFNDLPNDTKNYVA
jgi:hypothetical protein